MNLWKKAMRDDGPMSRYLIVSPTRTLYGRTKDLGIRLPDGFGLVDLVGEDDLYEPLADDQYKRFLGNPLPPSRALLRLKDTNNAD